MCGHEFPACESGTALADAGSGLVGECRHCSTAADESVSRKWDVRRTASTMADSRRLCSLSDWNAATIVIVQFVAIVGSGRRQQRR